MQPMDAATSRRQRPTPTPLTATRHPPPRPPAPRPAATACCRCGTSFEVYVTSSIFEGKRVLERHKLVTAALAPLMAEIHALSIKATRTPEEEAAKQQQQQYQEQQQKT